MIGWQSDDQSVTADDLGGDVDLAGQQPTELSGREPEGVAAQPHGLCPNDSGSTHRAVQCGGGATSNRCAFTRWSGTVGIGRILELALTHGFDKYPWL